MGPPTIKFNGRKKAAPLIFTFGSRMNIKKALIKYEEKKRKRILTAKYY